MTRRRPVVTALFLCVGLGMPGGVAAASFSPLDGMTGPEAPLPGLDTPAAPKTGMASDMTADTVIVTGPLLDGPEPFKFENDTGLDANPLRSVLPDDQWANPRAAGNTLLRRR